MRIRGPNDSKEDDSWHFKDVVVVTIVVLLTFTPVIIFAVRKITKEEARIEPCTSDVHA
jgi:hypothetical protein